jgi:hypothetical protein
MRIAVVICSATLVSLAVVAPASAAAKHVATGTLAGRTQIGTSCPIPPASSSCDSWQPLPHATFTVTRLNSAGGEIAGTTRTVRSNSRATFRVVLRVGSYLVKPIPGATTRAGTPHRVHIAAGATTKTTVRFLSRSQPA